MKDFVKEMVGEILAAPSCCEPLKEAGEKLLAAEGKDTEAELTKEFIAELEKDVQPIEDSIAFFKSDFGKQVLGDQVGPMIESFEKAQAEGEKTCLCPACQAGAALLARKSEILG